MSVCRAREGHVHYMQSGHILHYAITDSQSEPQSCMWWNTRSSLLSQGPIWIKFKQLHSPLIEISSSLKTFSPILHARWKIQSYMLNVRFNSPTFQFYLKTCVCMDYFWRYFTVTMVKINFFCCPHLD